MSQSRITLAFSTWQRWMALLWLVLWIPVYWRVWGPSNFLQLCDIAVILTCIGIWTGNALLISSQAVSSLLIDCIWAVDVALRLSVGRHLVGATNYFFDQQYPLWIRLISLFHVVMPALFLWALGRIRYDSRGLTLQCFIAYFAFAAARFTNPVKNMNYAFADPFFHWVWGPGAIHALVNTVFMLIVVYLPTHLLLKRLFPPRDGIDC